MIISSCNFQGNISLLVRLPFSSGPLAYSQFYIVETRRYTGAEMGPEIVCGVITGASQLLVNFPPVLSNSARSLNESYLVPVFISFLKW